MSALDGHGDTPLEQAWRRDEQERPMTEEDRVLGGPRRTLTVQQYAKANGYSVMTGQKLPAQLYDYDDFILFTNGTCTHKGRPISWYKDQRTGKPWLPAKRKSFVSLVKGLARDDVVVYLDEQ